MKSHFARIPLALLLTVVVAGGADWRQFRGTDNTSVANETGVPTNFGEGRNVAWKIELPGRGVSCPIVVGDRIFVTCSTGPREDRLHLIALDAADGGEIWHRQLWATGHTEVNSFGAVAANTPASDGESVFAFYSSNDLASFDLDGNLQWFRGLAADYPATRNDVGMASSPLVVGETLIVQCENQGESFAAGLDKRTGLTRWRIDREQDAIWSSPTVLRGAKEEDDIALLHGRSALTGLDPQTGKELFRYEASLHTIASVTTLGNRVFVPANGLHALEYNPKSGEAKFLWYERRLRGGNSSPVVFDGRALRVTGSILTCAELDGGRTLWKIRLEDAKAIWATPLVVDGVAYVADYEGKVFVIRCGDEGEVIAVNSIGAGVLASPIAAGGALYLRDSTHLWKIGNEE